MSKMTKENLSQILTCKLVLHHSHDGTDTILLRRHDLINQDAAGQRICRDQSLFTDVGCKFVASHRQHLTPKSTNDKRLIL